MTDNDENVNGRPSNTAGDTRQGVQNILSDPTNLNPGGGPSSSLPPQTDPKTADNIPPGERAISNPPINQSSPTSAPPSPLHHISTSLGTPAQPHQELPQDIDWDTILKLLTDFRQAALLNYGEMNAIKVVYNHPSDHTIIERDFLSAVAAVFAPPKEFRALQATLSEPGSILVLNAPPDTGRKMTAYALLAHMLDQHLISEAREIIWGSFRDSSFSNLPPGTSHGYLLHLPEDEEGSDLQVSGRFGSKLHSLNGLLLERQSRLIVITNPAQWSRIGLGVPHNLVPTYSQPEAASIAARWLTVEDSSLQVDKWLQHPEIKRLLDGESPLGALEIVDLILSAHRSDSYTPPSSPSSRSLTPAIDAVETDFQQRVSSVVAARRDWRQELLDWHKVRDRTGFERDFLVAASVLRAAPVAHVYAKAAMLSKELNGKDLRIVGQEEAGVLELVSTAGAHLSDGVVVFDRPGWDDAALEYFWDDRPLSRRPFLKWLAEAPVQDVRGVVEPLSQDDREALAERISGFAIRWAVRHRRREPLEDLANSWRRPKRRRLWNVLINLLDTAAIADSSARYIHVALLAWAKGPNPALREAVAAVCAGEFGRSHPDKALRRISYVGESTDTNAAGYLAQAVVNLWTYSSVREALFYHVMNWCTHSAGDEIAGHWSFAVLASTHSQPNSTVPRLLEAGPDFLPSASRLSVGWKALLDQASDPDRELTQLLSIINDVSTVGTEDETQPNQDPTNQEIIGSITRQWLSTAFSDINLAELVIETLRLAVLGSEASSAQARLNLMRCYLSEWLDLMIEAGHGPEARVRIYNPLSEALDRDLKERMRDSLHHSQSEPNSSAS